MIDLKYSLSSYINDAIVKRRTNFIMEKFVSLLFMKVGFDDESLLTLKECSEKGKVVYASFQNSVTSLLILMNALNKNGYSLPYIAFDFRPYRLQVISNVFKRLYRFFSKLFRKKEFEPIGDIEFLDGIVEENKVIALSLLSSKTFKRRFIDKEADSLQYLIEIQKKTDAPIYVIPQIMFWNRNPERTKALLVPQATGDRNLISAIGTNVRSRTEAFIRLSTPVNLKNEIAEFPGDEVKEIARRVRNKLLESYSFEKRSTLGPVIKSRQEMMEKVLYHKNVLDAMNQLISEEHASEKKLRKMAYGYFKEIAADFSILWIEYFHMAASWVFRKVFNGINYNLEDFKKIREASQTGPLILVPSHKSHMDYLIVSSIFYENKLIPPHIVAGSNLLFFPMGKIFRRSGAFFMRRSFKGLKLYGVIFRQYVKTLINEGYSIEFFIEGGRSRTGKMVYPKMGILKYLIESIDEGYNKDMVFVPVSINYDRILEEAAYLSEIKGKEKKAESTSAFVNSRKLLKRKYGSVYLSFNDPISFQALRQKYADRDRETENIGLDITKRINEVIMVTPFSIVTTALLLLGTRGFTREIVKERVAQLHDYFTRYNVPMTSAVRDSDFDSIIDYVISSYQSDDIVMALAGAEGGDGSATLKDLYVVSDELRARINFYKNNIIHHLLPLSIVSLSMLECRDNDVVKLGRLKNSFKSLLDFLSSDFISKSDMENTDIAVKNALEFFESCGYCRREGEERVAVLQAERLKYYARSVLDFLESYLIVFRTVCETRGKTNNRELISEIRKRGIAMFHLGDVQLPESLSMPNYSSAIEWAVTTGILSEQRFGKKNVDMRVENPEDAQKMLQRLQNYIALVR